MNYEPAGFGKRFGAYVLDWIVLPYLIIFVLMFVLGFIIGIIGFLFNVSEVFSLGVVEAMLALFCLFFFVLYPLFKDGLFNGQSLGRKVFSLKVVRYSNQELPCSFIQSLKRNFLFFIPFVALISAFQVDGNPEHRRLGDSFADTVVVDLKKQRRNKAAVDTGIAQKKTNSALIVLIAFLAIVFLIVIALVFVGVL